MGIFVQEHTFKTSSGGLAQKVRLGVWSSGQGWEKMMPPCVIVRNKKMVHRDNAYPVFGSKGFSLVFYGTQQFFCKNNV
jgi:hypothetical protein